MPGSVKYIIISMCCPLAVTEYEMCQLYGSSNLSSNNDEVKTYLQSSLAGRLIIPTLHIPSGPILQS